MEPSASKIERTQLNLWKKIVNLGCFNASQALREMLGVELDMTGVVLAFMPLAKIPFLAGNPEEEVFGSRVLFFGDISGQMLLILPMESAKQLVDVLMGRPLGTCDAFHEVEISAIAEVCNIVSSCFIRDLANFTYLNIRLTPPEVIKDMTATILEAPLVSLSLQSDKALIIKTTFSTEELQIKGYFFFMPDFESIERIITRFKDLLDKLFSSIEPLQFEEF